jgi:subtilisin family serine protease
VKRINIFRSTLTITLGAVFAVGCGNDFGPIEPRTPTADYEPPAALSSRSPVHILVMTEERRPSDDLLEDIAARGGTIVRNHDVIGVLSVAGLTDGDAEQLALRGDVDGIDRDQEIQWLPPGERHPQVITFDQDNPQDALAFDQYQWNMRQINADDAWAVTPKGEGALVCVLDTGVDPEHIELAGIVDLERSTSFVPSEPFIEDGAFHGTFVSALIAGNALVMAPVAPKASLCAVKVLRSVTTEDGEAGTGSFDWLISGILYAASVDADVINMSLGAVVPKREAFQLVIALQRAILYAVAHGVLPVAATGNDGLNLDENRDLIAIPAQLLGVVAVSATAPTNQMNFDEVTGYSNIGRRLVDIAAPGGDFIEGLSVEEDLILSACTRFLCGSNQGYLIGAGTSFAAPHVAAAAAVVESTVPGDQHGLWLHACLVHGADQIDGKPLSPLYGRGRLDVLDAVSRFGCGKHQLAQN